LSDHIGARDAYRDVIHRRLKNPLGFPILYEESTCWLYTSNDSLILGAVAPNWRDSRNLSKDEHVSDLLDQFLTLASQYVARSRILRVQAGLALTHAVAADFRRADLHRLQVPADGVMNARRELELRDPKTALRRTARSRELAAWVVLANPLDPLVHRALYQYWRAASLIEADFWEEAITALDNVVAVAAEAVQRWHRLAAQPSRREVARCLKMSKADEDRVDEQYGLRCGFGAHPAHSKWWDFAEIYEGELDVFPEVVERVLLRLFASEQQFRTVDPDPSAWAPWFQKHAELLLDAVWGVNLGPVRVFHRRRTRT
jgi:hypothetical protein